jgi:hypothetical protein
MRVSFFAIVALLGCIAATPADFAVINNSGSTNSNGYMIQIWPDGAGSVAVQTREGRIVSMLKPFKLPPTVAIQFFADLAAARNGGAATVPCMKTVSFGASLRVSWQGWESPDLTCPPKDSLGDALVRDVEAIDQTAGVSDSQSNPLLRTGSSPSIPPP